MSGREQPRKPAGSSSGGQWDEFRGSSAATGVIRGLLSEPELVTQFGHMAPHEIDAEYLPLWDEATWQQMCLDALWAARDKAREQLASPDPHQAWNRATLDRKAAQTIAWCDANEAEFQRRAMTAAAAVEPYEDEYDLRQWKRYWWVVSSPGGHIHNSMSCSTCSAKTGFRLFPAVSGRPAGEAIDMLGERMCSVCFPDAPVELVDGKASALAARVAKLEMERREELARVTARLVEQEADGDTERAGVTLARLAELRSVDVEAVALAQLREERWDAAARVHAEYKAWRAKLKAIADGESSARYLRYDVERYEREVAVRAAHPEREHRGDIEAMRVDAEQRAARATKIEARLVKTRAEADRLRAVLDAKVGEV